MRLTNFRSLRVFEAVARLGSFVEASKALHMTPAAVSLAIRDLEAALEFRVFERTTRSVRLTDSGRQYFVHVERVMKEVREAESCASALRKGTFESVRIATTPAVIATLLGIVYERAPRLWPNVKVTTVEVPTHQLQNAIDSRLADLTIGVHLLNDDRNECETLFTSRWGALLPRDHPLARRRVLTWRDLAAEPIVVVNESSRLRIQSVLPADIVLENVHTINTTVSALAYAASGHAIAVVPGYVCPLGQVHRLRSVPITDPDVSHVLEIGIARRPRPSEHVRQVHDFLVAEVRNFYKDLA